MSKGMYSVDELLKMSISNISETILKYCHFDNEELEEIILKFEDRYLNGKTTLYQKLIRTQEGPFSRDIFNLFVKYFLAEKFGIDIESALQLLEKSTGLTDDDIEQWFKYSFRLGKKSFITDFIKGDISKKHGIDITTKPWNGRMPLMILKYGHFTDETWKVINTGLNTLNDDDKLSWYFDAIKQVHEINMTGFMVGYENATTEMIDDFYFNVVESQHKDRVAMHQNASEKIKLEMFEKTQDIKFLPDDVKDFFGQW